jgi:hypothetical protein
MSAFFDFKNMSLTQRVIFFAIPWEILLLLAFVALLQFYRMLSDFRNKKKDASNYKSFYLKLRKHCIGYLQKLTGRVKSNQ